FFRAADNEGQVRLTDTVRSATRILSVITISIRHATPDRTYSVLWKPPPGVIGLLRHCVQAVDRAGNRSPTSCAGLEVARPDLCPQQPSGAFDSNQNGCPGPYERLAPQIGTRGSVTSGGRTTYNLTIANLPVG